MDEKERFLSEIDGYLARTGTAPSIFSRHAMGDFSFLSRIRETDRTPTLATVKKVRAFMHKNPKGIKKPKKKGGR